MATGVKRSLFSKPAWAAPAASTSSSNTEKGSIFSRNVNYDDIVRAEKAERERKAAKAKARSGKEKSEGPESKRQRISTEREDERTSTSDSDGQPKKEKTRERPVTRSTPQKEKTLESGLDASPKLYQSPRRRGGKAIMINLDGDDDDDELIMLTPPKPKNTTPKKSKKTDDLDEENSEEEDEYLRQLKQKAREKARLQRQGSHTEKRPSTPLSRGVSAAIEDGISRSSSIARDQNRPASSGSAKALGASRQTPASEQEDDPEIKILIQSEIPGAKSLVVKRKASQSLKQVKEFWCRKFELEESVARQVFFTWKGTRLFDSTTMRGIILGLKKDYHRQQRSTSFDDDEDEFDDQSTKDPSGGNIMLEAMTQEIYDKRQREKERAQRQQDHSPANSDQDEGDEDEETAATRAAAVDCDAGAIIIRLVAKDLEPMQLRVRPHTTMGKIMRGFAATRRIAEGKTPWLIFDGERLEMEGTVEEVGFEDEDEVEVSIR